MGKIVMFVSGDAVVKPTSPNLTVVKIQAGQPVPSSGEKLIPNIPKPPEVRK